MPHWWQYETLVKKQKNTTLKVMGFGLKNLQTMLEHLLWQVVVALKTKHSQQNTSWKGNMDTSSQNESIHWKRNIIANKKNSNGIFHTL